MSIVSRLINRPQSFSIEMLQRGVQNGTIPAYIGIPLIQEKLQDQKEMQGAQAAAMMGQSKPTPVAERVMAEASQANQPPRGVEALRSNLPAQFAAGGIVAFADGGDVERYQNKGYTGNPDGMTQEERDRRRMVETLRSLGYAGMDIGTLPVRGLAGAFESVVTRPLRAVGVPVPYLPESFYGGNRESMTPYMDRLRTERGEIPAISAAPATTAPAATAPTAPAAPSSGTDLGGQSPAGRTPAVGAQPSALLEPPRTPSMVDTTRTMLYGTETEPGFFARAATRQAELDKKVQEAEGKVTGKAFEGLESDLRKEALELGADREQAKYMAMFKAGLAMMAGTSRHALENIGKGAMVGAEDYQRAAADIKKSQKENRRMMANIEQARRAEAIGDRDRAVNRLEKAGEAEERRDLLGINAIMQATGKDRDQATEIWKSQYAAAADERRTHIAGGYQLAAANARAARGAGITPYQLAQLRARAQTRIDPESIRSEIAKSLKLSTTPAAGADPAFDKRVAELYARRVDEMVTSQLGGATGPGATSFAGFKLLGPEE